MPSILAVAPLGNQLLVKYSDTSRQVLIPNGQGGWMPKAGIPDSPDPVTPPPDPGGGTGGGTPGTVAAPVDDYPWPNGTVNDVSPLRFDYRECVDFVCWRLNRDKGCTSAPWKYTWGDLRPSGGNGDAIGWRGDWLILGWKVDIAPKAGCVAWYGSSAGAYGHVAYVQSVTSNGTVKLEEYNWSPYHHAYNPTVRSQAPGSTYYPDSFLQAPPG